MAVRRVLQEVAIAKAGNVRLEGPVLVAVLAYVLIPRICGRRGDQ